MTRPAVRGYADARSTGWVDVSSGLTSDWEVAAGSAGAARIRRTADTVVCQLLIRPSATNTGASSNAQRILAIPSWCTPMFYGAINTTMPMDAYPVGLSNTSTLNVIAAIRPGVTSVWTNSIPIELRWETSQPFPAQYL